MALQGDLATFGLADLLQWLEQSKATGCTSVSAEGVERRLYTDRGELVSVAYPGQWELVVRQLVAGRLLTQEAASQALGRVRRGERSLESALDEAGGAAGPARELALEDLKGALAGALSARSGRFAFAEETLPLGGDEPLALSLHLRELLFEGFRLADEQAQVDRVVGSDSSPLGPGEPPASLGVPGRVVLRQVEQQGPGATLGSVRLALGMGHTVCARQVYELYLAGALRLPGRTSPPPPDPLAAMLSQGSALLKAGELDAAALLCASLRAADPTDRRVREFSRAVEGEQVARLYAALLPMQIYERAPAGDERAKKLRSDERQVLQLVNGVWDVATLSLASPLREVETLRALQRLGEMGLVRPIRLA